MTLGSRLAAAAALATVLIAPAQAAEAPSAVKIAFVLGLSGPLALIGADMKRGFELALEERQYKINGVPIEATWDDSEGKPQVTVQKASQRIAQGAHMLVGEIGSPSTTALSGLAEQREVPLLVTFASDNALTTPGKLKWTFRTGKTTQANVTAAVTAARGFGVQRVFGMAPDYEAGREAWYVAKRLFEEAGVAITGEAFHPTPNRDFAIIIQRAMGSGADGIFTVSQGNDAATFLKQAAEVGLKDKLKVAGSGLIDDSILRSVGPAGLGIGSNIRYHWSEDTPANKSFVKDFRQKYGELPAANAGDAYDGLRWWLRVVEGSKSWDKKDWISAMAGNVIEDSIEGRKDMGACDHQARQIALVGLSSEYNAPDLPKYGMKITKVIPAAEVYKACP